ncbi:MAG: PorT family protein [Bacteroidetes bacterium]|nr:MAG: PorT family protein [Bacteroidota bacterium]
MTEKELIELYRRQMAEKKASAPEGLWTDISRKLVVEEAWDNIAATLEKDTQKKGFWYFALRAAAVAAIISFGVLSVWLLSPGESEPRLAEETRITTPPPVDTETIEPAQDQQPLTTDTRPPATELAELPGTVVSDSEDTQPITETEDLIAPQQISSDEELYTPALASIPETLIPRTIQTGIYGDAYSALLSSMKKPIQMNLDDLNLSDVSYAFSYNNTPPGSFSLGITTAIKNTWLINNETFEGFDRLNHNRTDLKFYPDIGINMHYQHTQRWGMETGLFLSSSTGQTYRQYIHGKYTHRSISLNYLQFELMASHTTGNRLFRNTGSVRLKSMLGFYASLMNSATEIIENDQFDVKPLYSGLDYGLVLGQYLQWQPARRIVFSPGVHVKWGLTDIYLGGTNLPLNFSNTYNRSIEFRLNVYYTLGR